MSIGYKLFHQEIFQGHLSKRKYFEGWYYKMVSADEMKAIALIPGVALFNKKERHAFIQVFNGIDHTTSYHRFDIKEFRADKRELDISVGNNHFSKKGVKLDLPEIKGEISFSNMISPVTSMMSPGVMGWFSYIPFMQCKHGVVSMHHDLDGNTTGSFGPANWRNGIGYIEKDWGASFPKCWIWMHSNHFDEKKPASIMASVAHVPWMGRFFPGFIVLLVIEGVEYRFATYNQSMMKCLVFEDVVLLEFRHRDLHLMITAYRGETATLHMPFQGQMTGKMSESLRARLELRLLRDDQEIWSSSGTTAGLDIYGDTTVLECSKWRKLFESPRYSKFVFMLRIICVGFYMLLAFSAISQNQPNPFDLKFRTARPSSLKAGPSKDTTVVKTPILPKPQEPLPEKVDTAVVDTAAQNAAKRISTKSEMNPFEKESGPKKTPQKAPEKLSQGTSDVQFHTNPTVTPTAIGSRHMSKGIQIFFILLSLLFLIFIVNVERNFVNDLWRVISNENYSSLHLRNQRNTMRQILLIMGYMIFLIQAGIFLWHVLALFQYSGGYLSSIWSCIGFVVLIYAIRHLVIRYLRWLFNNEKEMSLFGFDISTFNIMVGLVLLPVNVILNFGPDSLAKPLVIIGLIVIAVAYLMRQLRWMLTARQLIANSLFLFFVYLCAVEILPLWAILTYFW